MNFWKMKLKTSLSQTIKEHGSAELKRIAWEFGATDLLTKPNFLNLELAVRMAMPQ